MAPTRPAHPHPPTHARWRRATAAAAVIVVTAGVAWAQTPARPLAAVIEALRPSAAERAALGELYGPSVVPLWIRAGALTSAAHDALGLLESSSRHGLDPADYLSGPLLGSRAAISEDRQAAFDVALSHGVLRYMRHLHRGRVDPRTLGIRLDKRADLDQLPARLRAAIQGNRVAGELEAAAPRFSLYRQLFEALPRYRAIAARRDPPVAPFSRAVKPGEPYADAHALGVHLAARGDLADNDVPPVGFSRYEGALVEGVRRFQTRHGLAADGVLGARTIVATRVPASLRVQQIVMALERLRWLPDVDERRLIAINIPMFTLWAWDAPRAASTPAFTTRVIVGKARRTETPVLTASLEHVIFRPYWNVPRSILRGEVLPAIRRNPRYLAQQQMEVVAGQGDDARPLAVGPGTLEALAAGSLRVRQRPGPHNALGLVKFVFPNAASVYLHGTPTPSLFARDRRDFSHGCIRVADPEGLARWVLAGESGWDATRIDRAMHATVSERVELAESIDVVLFYVTAAVSPEDGAVHFADDIYGKDARLAQALGRSALSR